MKILSIKKSSDFKLINNKGRKFHSKTIILLTKESQLIYSHNPQEGRNSKTFCRSGFTVAKTVSKSSVKRNSIKRRLREAFKTKISQVKVGFDYVVIAKKEALEADYKRICEDLRFCLKHIHQQPIIKNTSKK